MKLKSLSVKEKAAVVSVAGVMLVTAGVGVAASIPTAGVSNVVTVAMLSTEAAAAGVSAGTIGILISLFMCLGVAVFGIIKEYDVEVEHTGFGTVRIKMTKHDSKR